MPTSTQSHSIVEMTPWQLCQRVTDFVGKTAELRRVIVAIAGPPAAGKSTLLPILLNSLQNEFGQNRVTGVPMDGFHLDNVQLEQAGSLARKGSPHTFDIGGLLYLLLDQPGWRELSEHFDLTISIDVADDILQKRLVQRWLTHGLSAEDALIRARSNDLLNAATVREQSLAANIVYRPEID